MPHVQDPNALVQDPNAYVQDPNAPSNVIVIYNTIYIQDPSVKEQVGIEIVTTF